MDTPIPVCYQYLIFSAIVSTNISLHYRHTVKTILLSSNPMKSLQYIAILLLLVKYILRFKKICDNVIIPLDIFLM